MRCLGIKQERKGEYRGGGQKRERSERPERCRALPFMILRCIVPVINYSL
jgi:hypothetical protein